jgi:outer membrane lipoprotein-sorting protein
MKECGAMIHRISPLLLVAVFLIASSNAPFSIENASTKYKKNNSYPSLETIASHLHKGMQHTQIDHLLAEPDYSSRDGKYY